MHGNTISKVTKNFLKNYLKFSSKGTLTYRFCTRETLYVHWGGGGGGRGCSFDISL
jgi:hypothetical protein